MYSQRDEVFFRAATNDENEKKKNVSKQTFKLCLLS